jgi:diguanylate cyclase (GGDEF)-like protein/PAS domain S-box-containing protein
MAEKVKILIADDSQTSLMILCEEFKPYYEVVTAGDGEECLRTLKHYTDIELVVLDLLMPEMTGFNVLEKMAADDRLARIPVIAISASDNNDDLIDALDLGAYDVMPKPINLPILRHKIQNLLTRRITAKESQGVQIRNRFIANIEVDEKTGIYNRRSFIRKTRELLNANPTKRYIIIRYDIDGFKVLNDVYGVDECDRILKSIGDTFKKKTEDFEECVYGRWESDHFVICMRLDDFHRLHVADHYMDPPSIIPNLQISLRMGVYVIDDPSLDVALMCDRAFLALKTIKDNFTRNIAFYDDTMRLSLIEKQQLVNEMNQALDSSQFTIYLQPQYNYLTGALHGAEALVRWIHPEKGIIPPIKFIPLFEQNGFITHLDKFVWEEACRYQRKWLNMGIGICPISVNVSRTDICSMNVAEHFKYLVDKYSLPTSSIHIEITESAYIDNPSLLIGAVRHLRDAGFCVEMDDFGSGYSSLNTLKDVPVDMLKLDMKFIESEGREGRGGPILSSVVRMSKWLKLPIIAEGVETQSQAEFLKSIGCMYMQGYYFAKPMPAADYEGILSGAERELKINEPFYDDVDNAMEFLNSNSQANRIFNSFVGGAAIIEYDGEEVEAMRVNDRFFDVLETDRSEYTDRTHNLLEWFDQINCEKIKKTIAKAVISGREVFCEVSSNKIHEEREIWLRAGVRVLVSNVDRYLMFLTIENITERMSLLAVNLKLTDQMSAIINNIPGGVADLEIDSSMTFRILGANEKNAQMFGYTNEEYMREFGKNMLGAVYPDDMEKVRNAGASLYSGQNSSFNIRFRHICRNGAWRWVTMIGNRTRHSKTAIYVTTLLLDIDEQVRAEQRAAGNEREFARRERLFDVMLESTPYGVVQVLITDDSYEFRTCNTNAWKYLNYDNREQFIDELIASNFKINEMAENIDEIQEGLTAVLVGEDQQTFVFDAVRVAHDGTEVLLHNIVKKIVVDNEIHYLQHLYIPVESPNKPPEWFFKRF